MMYLFLQQNPQTLFSFANIMVTVFGLLVVLGAAMLVLLSKRKDSISEERGEIIKVRDIQVSDCEKKCAKCQEELEDVTVELRAITSVHIKELMDYWQIRENELARMQTLESDNRILKIRLGGQSE